MLFGHFLLSFVLVVCRRHQRGTAALLFVDRCSFGSIDPEERTEGRMDGWKGVSERASASGHTRCKYNIKGKSAPYSLIVLDYFLSSSSSFSQLLFFGWFSRSIEQFFTISAERAAKIIQNSQPGRPSYSPSSSFPALERAREGANGEKLAPGTNRAAGEEGKGEILDRSRSQPSSLKKMPFPSSPSFPSRFPALARRNATGKK